MTKTMTHVEELRHVASLDQCSWDYAQKLLRSSADEIEQLRAAIQWIADYPDPVGRKEPWHEAWHQCVWKAEEALNGRPAEPSEGYSQEYADQMRTALLRIAAPVYLNLKPAYADPDNVKAICDGLNERIKISQDALLGLGKKSGGGHSNLCACPACLQARGREAIDNAVKANEGQS